MRRRKSPSCLWRYGGRPTIADSTSKRHIGSWRAAGCFTSSTPPRGGLQNNLLRLTMRVNVFERCLHRVDSALSLRMLGFLFACLFATKHISRRFDRRSGFHLLSIRPKSSFGEHKVAKILQNEESNTKATYKCKLYAPQTKILEG